MKSDKCITQTLYSFAYCGKPEGFLKMLAHLSSIAEKEIWDFDKTKPFEILRIYIFKTFEQCNKQGKVLYSNDRKWCCTNTGLLTPNGKDIMMIFDENKSATPDQSPWHFKSFRDSTDREYMLHFNSIPELASYTENYDKFYFKPDYTIEVNMDHILDDNWDRIKNQINLPKSIIKALLNGVIEETKKKVRRNMRLVVPQYYKDEIMYLMPIRIPIDENKYVTMALAIEETENHQYRANTIFTKDIAYSKARLLMKPEANWLIEDE